MENILVPQILELKVIANEKTLGVISQVLISGNGEKLVGFLVHRGIFKWAKILPLNELKEIKSDEVFVGSKHSLIKKKSPGFIEHLRAANELIGKKVFNQEEMVVGKVRSASYETKTGVLNSLILSKGALVTITSGTFSISADQVISFEVDKVVIDEAKTKKVSGGISGQLTVVGSKLKNLRKEAEKLVTTREAKFVVGKTASREVEVDGDVIVSRGDVITEDHVAKANDADKLHQLALAAGVSGIRTKWKDWTNTSEDS